MIIVAIIALSLVVIGALAAAIVNVPVVPTYVLEYLQTFTTYTNMGIKIFFSFVYQTPVMVMLGISLALGVIIATHNLIMWVATKIPMFGVSR